MRENTKIGDVFVVRVDDEKRYFQYVASDLAQLNSDVIRAFKRAYPMDANPRLLDIVNSEVEFYEHCVTKLGLKMKCGEKVGNTTELGDTKQILFICTNDYGTKAGEEPIRVSQNWYVWRINDDDFTRVGKLEGNNRTAYIGLVINPLGIIELLKGNKYPINYPDFE